MPNWKTHLEIAKRIKSKFNYDEYNLFLFGSILPDINNCYLVKNISAQMEHNYTHFYSEIEPMHLVFYKQYRELLDNNPIVYGYFIHLFTDYIWNNDFYTKICLTKYSNLTRLEKILLKQNDFRSYNNKFYKNKISIDNIDLALNYISKIDRVSITKDDIKTVIEFINNQNKKEINLNFYKEKELDDLLNKTIETIDDFVSNKNN